MIAADLRKQVIDVIPMAFLIANDVPGATGPTEQCDVVQAVRDLTAAGRSAVNRCLAAEAVRGELLAALKECALQIAQNHGRKLTESEHIALDWARDAIAKAEAA